MLDKNLVQFGRCVYSYKTRTLRRDGVIISVEPMAVNVLEFLIANRGRIVSRADLIRDVWKCNVTSGAVDYQISTIRKAIGDCSRTERLIESKAKCGWRFAAEIRDLQTPVAELPRLGRSGRQSLDLLAEEEHDQFRNSSDSPGEKRPANGQWIAARTRPAVIAGILAIAATLLAIAGTVVRTEVPPQVSEFHQVTNDGRPKRGPLFTDGRRLYLSEQRDGGWRVVSIPVAGDSPRVVAGIEADVYLEDVAADGQSLLLRRVSPNREELFIFRPSDRSLRLVGEDTDTGAWFRSGDKLAISDETSVSYLEHGTRRKLFKLSGRRSTFLEWVPGGQVLRAWLRRPGDEPLTVWDFNLRRKDMHEVQGLSKNSDWTTRGMWTRDGQSFIYSSGNDLQKDLWVAQEGQMQPGKRKPSRLTSGPGSWLWPVRGADDSTIFALQEQTRSELVGFDPNEGVWKPMWDGAPASNVEYSRDGKWVAFVHLPDHFLWKSKSDGTNPTPLTSEKVSVHQPHWSPDGRTIAFMGQKLNGDWRIFVVPSSGGRAQELSPAQEDQGVPSWSADGRSIVFGELLARRKREDMALRSVDVASRKVRILEGTEGLWSPRWSPDGKYLLAVTTDSKRIRLLRTGTSTWTDLFSAIFVDNVTWSYDSKFVYFDGLEAVGKLDIFRVSVPEGRLEKLTKLQGFVPSSEPWYGVSPDGTLLASRGFHSQEIFALKCILP